MIHITDSAQRHFYKLISNQNPGTQIRICVISPGTINAECNISYCSLDTIEDTDIKIEFEKIQIYIDRLSAPYLKDAEIDFIEEKFNSCLILKAPNINKIKRSNQDGNLTEQVRHFLHAQINPQLAQHGGFVHLIEITYDMQAILEFSGGCNGCSMIEYTVKDWIEKEILESFHEIKGVVDATQHNRSNKSYY